VQVCVGRGLLGLLGLLGTEGKEAGQVKFCRQREFTSVHKRNNL
jgi:hypothetical protein